MKQMLDGLTAMHSARRPYGINAASAQEYGPSSMRFNFSEKAHDEIEHPVVRTHGETGRKALYVNRTFTLRFKDMTEEESAPLLSWLYRHCGTAGIHLSLPMAGEFDRVLGQPLCPAQRHKRLPGPAPGHAPSYDRGRAACLSDATNASDGRSISRADRRLRLL